MGIHGTRGYLGRSLFVVLLSVSLAAAATSRAETLTVLSQNMNRLFDDIDDGNRETRLSSGRFQARVQDAAARIAGEFGLPHIIALQEIENLNVLRQIAERIRQRHGVRYRVLLIPGQDPSSINVGFLVRPELRIEKAEQLFSTQLLPAEAGPLFARPPLMLHACYLARCLSLVNLHLRSMRGIDSEEQGEWIADKRRRQAEAIAAWSNHLLQSNPETALLLLGDFNALTPPDRHVDIAGILRGSPDNSRTRLKSRDLLDPDLVDLTRQIPAKRRYSYIFRQRKQQLDYMFANRPLAADLAGIEYGRIDYRFSDHAGLLARFAW